VTGQVIDLDCGDLNGLGQAQAHTRELGWISSVVTISVLA
jgi:hypothetical protein